MAEHNPHTPRFSRAMLKLSGEMLMGPQPFGIDNGTALRFAREIKTAAFSGAQICVVIGGGNIYRGLAGSASGMDRVKADYLGMLATVMNALALGDALEREGQPASVFTAIAAEAGAKSFNRDDALADLNAGRVVVFGGGTGNPFFTTDTTAALRAAEMNCDVILKGTKVDGIYSADPKLDPSATRYDRLTYEQALTGNIQVMDSAAFALARDAQIPIAVFSLQEEGSILRALSGDGPATLVSI